MKCEHCEKPATVHVTHVANGKVVKTHLCEECAEKLGVANTLGSIADTLLGPVSPITRTRAVSCPSCGLSLRKFQKEGRLGCPDCYEVFAREIRGVLESLHEADAHRGRTPKRLHRDPDPEEHLSLLRNRLSEAIKTEAFEEAARIRDEIRELSLEPCPGETRSP
jgi:protein arginine kinase activator